MVADPMTPDADIDGLVRRLRECDPSEYLQEEAAALIEALRKEVALLTRVLAKTRGEEGSNYRLSLRIVAAEQKLAEIHKIVNSPWPSHDDHQGYSERLSRIAALARSTSTNGG